MDINDKKRRVADLLKTDIKDVSALNDQFETYAVQIRSGTASSVALLAGEQLENDGLPKSLVTSVTTDSVRHEVDNLGDDLLGIRLKDKPEKVLESLQKVATRMRALAKSEDISASLG